MTTEYDAKILADSISPAEHRLTTFEVTFPRIVLAEFNTHRMLSRNSASSRAIPVAKRIATVMSDPFVPAVFGKNMPGMQHGEVLDEEDQLRASAAWRTGLHTALSTAESLAGSNVHKQLANRVLEPYSWHTVIVTATDWENFFNLRCHQNAQPEIRTVVEMMRELHRNHLPRPLNSSEWHLPLVQRDERIGVETNGDIEVLAKISAARCARVSYLTHDGKRDLDADLELYKKLTTNGHMSPLEHPARPMTEDELRVTSMCDISYRSDGVTGPTLRVKTGSTASVVGCEVIFFSGKRAHVASVRGPFNYCGNFNGWVQLRKLIPGETVFTS